MRLQRLILILGLILGLGLLIVGMQTAITSLTYANSRVDAATNWPFNAKGENPYPTTIYSFNPLASYGYPSLFGGYSSSMIFGGYMPFPGMNGYMPFLGMNGYIPYPGMSGYMPYPGMNGYMPYPGMSGYMPYPGMSGYSSFMPYQFELQSPYGNWRFIPDDIRTPWGDWIFIPDIPNEEKDPNSK